MLQGMLVISLDPPFFSFTQSAKQASTKPIESCCYCTEDEIKQILLDCGVIDANHLRECILRMQCELSKAAFHDIFTRHGKGIGTLKTVTHTP